MRFSHTADCHIGGHRDPKLRKLTEEAFERFVTQSIADRVDFCLIAGDLFNTAIPGIDALKFTVEQLGRLKQKNIPVYAIPGSHDFSPSGKTMLAVLEQAELLVNVFKGDVDNGKLRLQFTVDKKTGVKLTGILGKRGMLDKQLYEDLDRSIEQEPGEKIFLFHTTLTELKPANMQQAESQSVSFLPENFTYYAGGHVHIVKQYDDSQHRNVVYPGPLFPNSFSELETLKHGGYYLYDNGELTRKDITLKRVIHISLNVDNLTGIEANNKLHALKEDVHDAIVLLRLEGTLREGSPSDIDLRGFIGKLDRAYTVLRNTAKLQSQEFEHRVVERNEQDMEEVLLQEHKDQLATKGADGVQLARQLMTTLGSEQKDGEKQYEYQERVTKDGLTILEKFK